MSKILKFLSEKLIIIALVFNIIIAGIILINQFLSTGFEWSNFVHYLLILFFLVSIFILIYYYLSVKNPINHLIKSSNKLINTEIKTLTTAISDLAQGDLTAHLSISSKEIKSKNMSEIGALLDSFNNIIKYINGSAFDFNDITAIPCNRLCYVGADGYLEGEEIAYTMGEVLKVKGKVALIISTYKNPGANLRRKGFQTYITKNYDKINIVEVVETFEKQELTYNKTIYLLKKYPDLSAIYVVEGATPYSAARALIDQNKAGHVKIVAHDLVKETMEYLIKGVITATVSQNPYVQGYEPLMHLYNFIAVDETPGAIRLLTNLEIITKNNYKEVWDDDTGAKISEKTRKNLTTPLPRTLSKKIKLAIILPEYKLFWNQVAKGARDAEKKLLEIENVEVKAFVPDIFKSFHDWTTKNYEIIIESLISEGFTGIALPLQKNEIVPFLNRKIDSGITFVTFNAETIGLRGMLDVISKHNNKLFSLGESLASSSTETNQATTQISGTMDKISSHTQLQLNQLSETKNFLEELLKNIQKIIGKSVSGVSVAKKTTESANLGYVTVQKTREMLQNLQKSSELTSKIINNLNSNTMKIKEIILIIDDVASKTDILAINASIQAAHAQESGKSFSIIANEIKKLSSEARTATKESSSYIENTLEDINHAVDYLSESIKEINESVEMSNKAEDSLKEIITASTENESEIRTIADVCNDIKELSEKVHESMKTLAKINNENTDAISGMATSTTEISEQTDYMNKMARILVEMAQSQKDSMAQFNL